MSIRTVIEINHDYLRDLADNPQHLAYFLLGLGLSRHNRDFPITSPDGLHGIRVLGQRHHSETLKLEVK